MVYAYTPRVDLIMRLLLAALLGGFIGYERETTRHAAGLRTHVLVAVGSALFTLLSIHMGRIPGSDSTRIAAQIVSGIGFLGAGTIIRGSEGIHGLTTAASLWAVSGVGMACGAAYYTGALTATVIILAVLALFRRLNYR